MGVESGATAGVGDVGSVGGGAGSVDGGALADNDDPLSELNVLRRELRQLQAESRDAALQIASQQDELIELRAALATAEADAEEALVREANLRALLDLQSLKRKQVEGTMAAAEALVANLREMVVEDQGGTEGEGLEGGAVKGAGDGTGEAPRDGVGERAREGAQDRSGGRTGGVALVGGDLGDGATSLDHVLDTIEEEPNRNKAEVERGVVTAADDNNKVEADRGPRSIYKQLAAVAGDTQRTGPAANSAKRPATVVTPIPSRPQSVPHVPERRVPALKRQSLPQTLSAAAPSPHKAAIKAAPPTSTLLASAFKPGSKTVDHRTPAIHSSSVQPGMPLPTEVAKIAKSEGVPRRTCLPTTIAATLSDAHAGEIFALASSLDSHWTVSGGDDKAIRVYEKSGELYSTIAENTRSVTALGLHTEFAADASESVLIYSGGSDGSVRAFRRHGRRKNKWTPGNVLQVHSQAVRKILVTDKGGSAESSSLVLTCSTDRTIRICDIDNSRKVFSAEAPSAVLDVAEFGAAAPGLVVSGHKDGGIRVWSPREESAIVGGGKIHMKAITSVSCLDDGHSVVSFGRDNAIRLSDIRMNIAPVRDMEGTVQAVSDWHRATANGRYVICGSGRQGNIGVWNVDTGKLTRRLSSQPNDSDADVLDMVARKLRNPGCVVVPLWTATDRFVCAHRTRQVSFWNCE